MLAVVVLAAIGAHGPAAARERAAAMFEVASDGRTANVPVALSSPFKADHKAVETERLDDQGCEGMAQGASRAERLASYWRYMKARWPDYGHRVVIVPGYGHDRAMFTERPELFDLLLGKPAPDAALPPPAPKGDPL